MDAMGPFNIQQETFQRMMDIGEVADPRRLAGELGKASESERIEAVAEQFEKILMKSMMAAMRQSLENTDIFGEGLGEEMFLSLFDDAVISQGLKGQSMGLKESMIEVLTKDLETKKTGEDRDKTPFITHIERKG